VVVGWGEGVGGGEGGGGGVGCGVVVLGVSWGGVVLRSVYFWPLSSSRHCIAHSYVFYSPSSLLDLPSALLPVTRVLCPVDRRCH